MGTLEGCSTESTSVLTICRNCSTLRQSARCAVIIRSLTAVDASLEPQVGRRRRTLVFRIRCHSFRQVAGGTQRAMLRLTGCLDMLLTENATEARPADRNCMANTCTGRDCLVICSLHAVDMQV